MNRHSWLVLLGVAVLGFFIAILVDHAPPSLIFADSTSTLWAWGYNGSGTLGDGTTTNRRIPTQETTGATNWSAIAAGIGHTVALKSSGTQPTPTPIPSTSAWGLAALAATLLVMTTVLIRRTSGHRPATRP